jgi:hypothetical protein
LTGNPFDRLDDVIAQLDNLQLKDPETRRVARLISEGFDALAEVLKAIEAKIDAIKANVGLGQ